MREDIAFTASDGTRLHGWLYRPYPADDSAPCPLLVMSHGFSAVKEMRLDPFAQAFVAAGFAVLLYDHRNFGASEGLPRGEIDAWAQVCDMRDAITCAQILPGIDAERIGLWGTSFSGGHVLTVAGIDRRVKCAVAQVPFISGSATVAGSIRPDILATEIDKGFAADRQARMRGAAPMRLPVVSADPAMPAALPTIDSWDGFQTLGAEAQSWSNSITLRSLDNAASYEPVAHIARIAPTPLLMIVARADWVTPTAGQLCAYELARQPKALELIEGGHFAAYTTAFDAASGAATRWFSHHLCPTGRSHRS
jgi:cephalosporin-C deacetylase-like acetyl esterase